MPESIRKKDHKVHREPGDAIEGDEILIQCRKPSKNWGTIRGSGQHNYFVTVAKKNAYAVLDRKFTNVEIKNNKIQK